MLLTFSVLYDKLISQEKLQTIRPENEHYQKFVPGRQIDAWWRNPRCMHLKRRAASQGIYWDAHNGPYKMGLADCSEAFKFIFYDLNFSEQNEIAVLDGFEKGTQLICALANAWGLTPEQVFEQENGEPTYWRAIRWEEWTEGPLKAPPLELENVEFKHVAVNPDGSFGAGFTAERDLKEGFEGKAIKFRCDCGEDLMIVKSVGTTKCWNCGRTFTLKGEKING